MSRPHASTFLLSLLGALAAWLGGPREGVSAPSVVVVVGPSRSDARVAEALLRTKAELVASGFEVREVAAAPGESPRAALDRAASEQGAALAVAIDRAEGAAAADVWVTDRLTKKTLVRTVQGAPDARVLALRTVELVRASLLELAPDLASQRVPSDIARFAAHPLAPVRATPPRGPWESFQLQLSGEGLFQASPLPPALLPSLGLSFGLPVGAFARLSIAAPSLSPDLGVPGGSVSLALQHGSLGLGFAGWVWRGRVAVEVSLSAGVLHAEASARVAAPGVGRSAESWAFAASLDGGLAFALADGWALPVSVSLLLAAPEPYVVFAGESLGSLGRPTLGLGLGARRRFP